MQTLRYSKFRIAKGFLVMGFGIMFFYAPTLLLVLGISGLVQIVPLLFIVTLPVSLFIVGLGFANVIHGVRDVFRSTE